MAELALSPTGSPSRPPTPFAIFDAINGFHRTAALKGAIDLDLFTAVADGATEVPAIAARIGAAEKGTRVLCDTLVVMGFLTKSGSSYHLTRDSDLFLNRRSRAYIGSISDFLVGLARSTGAFDDMAAVVRKGGAVYSEQGSIAPENPLWVSFARSMAALMAAPAELLAARLLPDAGGAPQVLDIAAGHGLFGIAFARQAPAARVTAVDWRMVLDVAEENASKAGVLDRYRTIPGSAFEVDFDGTYDIVLLTNFLHHFDRETCEGLLRRVHRVLRPGGRAAALEFVPNEDRVSPPTDAMFSLIMLATTVAGDAYTFAEFDGMFRAAGFSRCELIELSPLPQRVVIGHR